MSQKFFLGHLVLEITKFDFSFTLIVGCNDEVQSTFDGTKQQAM